MNKEIRIVIHPACVLDDANNIERSNNRQAQQVWAEVIKILEGQNVHVVEDGLPTNSAELTTIVLKYMSVEFMLRRLVSILDPGDAVILYGAYRHKCILYAKEGLETMGINVSLYKGGVLSII